MNKKILMLSVMSLLMIGIVSAGTISNEVFSFDKESNEVTLTYDYTVDGECLFDTPLVILDSKNNVVGRSSSGTAPCIICYGGNCDAIGTLYTGTFQMEVTVDLISKKQITDVDELIYSTNYSDWRDTAGLPDVKVRYAKMSLNQLNKELEMVNKDIDTTRSRVDKLMEKSMSYRMDGNFEKFIKIHDKSRDLEMKVWDLYNAQKNIGFYIGLK